MARHLAGFEPTTSRKKVGSLQQSKKSQQAQKLDEKILHDLSEVGGTRREVEGRSRGLRWLRCHARHRNEALPDISRILAKKHFGLPGQGGLISAT